MIARVWHGVVPLEKAEGTRQSRSVRDESDLDRRFRLQANHEPLCLTRLAAQHVDRWRQNANADRPNGTGRP